MPKPSSQSFHIYFVSMVHGCEGFSKRSTRIVVAALPVIGPLTYVDGHSRMVLPFHLSRHPQLVIIEHQGPTHNKLPTFLKRKLGVEPFRKIPYEQ